jgi:hypothetical protein
MIMKEEIKKEISRFIKYTLEVDKATEEGLPESVVAKMSRRATGIAFKLRETDEGLEALCKLLEDKNNNVAVAAAGAVVVKRADLALPVLKKLATGDGLVAANANMAILTYEHFFGKL